MNTLDKIVYQLKLKGLTDLRFQELAGLSAGTVRDWKSKKSKSYIKHLPKIADVLNVTPEYLLDEDDPFEGINKKEVFDRILDLKDSINQTDIMFYVRIGVSSTLFYKWKRGDSESYMEMLDDIAEYFGVSVDYLLGKESIDNYLLPGERGYEEEDEKDDHKHSGTFHAVDGEVLRYDELPEEAQKEYDMFIRLLRKAYNL